MNIDLTQSLTIFTDGSSLGNPGPGGYGVVIVSSQLGEVIELGGSKPSTTNNEMELSAVVAALSYTVNNTEEVHIFTDSSYVINGATKWMYGWSRNNWKKKDGEEVKNRFQWETLFSLIEERGRNTVTFHHTPGHVGIVGNERVDDIARELGEGKEVKLFRGTLKEYPLVDTIFDVSIDEASQAKKSHGKAKAYSYLSLVDDVVVRHQSWADTQQRVKGVSAKYKKAISPEHEKEILASWGKSLDDIKKA